MVYVSLEATFGVIAAAVPAVRPLFRRKKTSSAGVTYRSPLVVPLNSVQTECTGTWPMDHHRRTQRESRLQGFTFHEAKDKGDIERQAVSYSSSGQDDLCVGHGGIMRTTDLVIEHEQATSEVVETPKCFPLAEQSEYSTPAPS